MIARTGGARLRSVGIHILIASTGGARLCSVEDVAAISGDSLLPYGSGRVRGPMVFTICT